MGTNNLPAAENWQQFRDGLCAMIEGRRNVASSFTYLEVYLFITHCRTAFASPGSDKAEQALDAIADSGSFRLVAESRTDFLAMFPVAHLPEDHVDQLNENRQQARADDQTPGQAEAPKIGSRGSGQDSREKSQGDPCGFRPAGPSRVPRPARQGEHQAPLSARRGSGRPF